VADHKFDFINTQEFTDSGFVMRLKYLWVYIIVLKSFMVYVSDIFSAITMLTTKNWSNEIFKNCDHIEGCVAIPFNTGKWLFVGCIIFSFLLLAYESRKAKKIIASRDISYAFTNIMANNYYSLRSYDHFCFFDHISNSTKTSDDFAFFIFFTFKSWKRLLLADLPRQTINALTLYAVWLVKHKNPGNWYDLSKYFKGNSLSTSALTVTSLFTVLVCAGSLLLLFIAGLCYIPLLLHIRGNLKEYCCHKVDKRIDDIIKRKHKERRIQAARRAQKEAEGDFSHLKNKKGELIAQPLPQPTLPNLSVDDDDSSSVNTRVAPSNYAPSTYTKDYYKGDYPPMPAYNPHVNHPQDYAHYNPSSATLGYDDPMYPPQQLYDNDDNESQVHLASSAAPFARDPVDYRQGSPYGAAYSAHDVYAGRAGSTPHLHQQPPPHLQGVNGDRRSPPGQAPGYADAAPDYESQYAQSPSDAYGGYANTAAPTGRGRHYDEEVGGYGRAGGGPGQRPL
jgi:hypothetical protein